MPCTISIDDSHVTISPTGELSASQVVEIVHAHYPTLGQRGVLWDMAHADWSDMSHADFVAIAASTFRIRAFRPSGRTAYLVADRAAYARMWQYLNHAFKFGVPAEYQVFLDPGEALGWVSGNEGQRREA